MNILNSNLVAHLRNKMVFRREFTIFQDTDAIYIYNNETLSSIRNFYKSLGIIKRFEGSYVFQSKEEDYCLDNCKDTFLESKNETVYSTSHRICNYNDPN